MHVSSRHADVPRGDCITRSRGQAAQADDGLRPASRASRSIAQVGDRVGCRGVLRRARPGAAARPPAGRPPPRRAPAPVRRPARARRGRQWPTPSDRAASACPDAAAWPGSRRAPRRWARARPRWPAGAWRRRRSSSDDRRASSISGYQARGLCASSSASAHSRVGHGAAGRCSPSCPSAALARTISASAANAARSLGSSLQAGAQAALRGGAAPTCWVVRRRAAVRRDRRRPGCGSAL